LLTALLIVLCPPAAGAQSITEFPVPTANSNPFGIAPGPDGALWCTEVVANKIGRVTTAGSFTEFPVPGPAAPPGCRCSLRGIAAGPDGALSFTEPAAIGRVT